MRGRIDRRAGSDRWHDRYTALRRLPVPAHFSHGDQNHRQPRVPRPWQMRHGSISLRSPLRTSPTCSPRVQFIDRLHAALLGETPQSGRNGPVRINAPAGGRSVGDSVHGLFPSMAAWNGLKPSDFRPYSPCLRQGPRRQIGRCRIWSGDLDALIDRHEGVARPMRYRVTRALACKPR